MDRPLASLRPKAQVSTQLLFPLWSLSTRIKNGNTCEKLGTSRGYKKGNVQKVQRVPFPLFLYSVIVPCCFRLLSRIG
jgi:hypothetical protein